MLGSSGRLMNWQKIIRFISASASLKFISSKGRKISFTVNCVKSLLFICNKTCRNTLERKQGSWMCYKATTETPHKLPATICSKRNHVKKKTLLNTYPNFIGKPKNYTSSLFPSPHTSHNIFPLLFTFTM